MENQCGELNHQFDVKVSDYFSMYSTILKTGNALFYTRNISTVSQHILTHYFIFSFLSVPPLKMDKTRLNTDLVHIRDDEILIHGKQFQQERSHGSFRNYSGTISCHPLTQSDIQYWEVKVFLEPLKNPGGLLLFETGACVQASIDDGETACGNVHSFVMFAALCVVHRGICVQSRKHGRDTTCLQNVLENTEGAATDLWYGFLFNPMEGSVSIFDVKSGCVLVQLTHMETGLEYWPVFGVFNGHLAKVHMSVVSGVNITFDGHKKRWMQSALG